MGHLSPQSLHHSVVMAASLRSNLTFLSPHPSTTQPRLTRTLVCIRCGRRDNRGPLLKGRVLSIEAIQAVQALKRAHRTDPSADLVNGRSNILSRLIKSDLIAAFKELLRQDQIEIALQVFSAIRSEHNPVELGLYADLVTGLGRKGLTKEIDGLVGSLEEGGDIEGDDDKGLVALVRALIAAERAESTVRIYRLMKRCGWGSKFEMDEYLAKVLIKGLRSFGEEELANEIDEGLRRLLYKGVFNKANIIT